MPNTTIVPGTTNNGKPTPVAPGNNNNGTPAKPTTPPKTSDPTTQLNLVQQPAFDPRIRRLSQPFGAGLQGQGQPLQRGHMSWDPNVPWPTPYGDTKGDTTGQTWAKAPKVLFLFNPSTIAATYSSADGSVTSALIYPTAGPQPSLHVPLQQQISFTIMFDRTYELLTADPDSDMAKLGVEYDIAAVKQYTGMFSTVYGSGSGSVGNNTNPFSTAGSTVTQTGSNVNQGFSVAGGNVNQGVMQVTIGYVFFGGGTTGLNYYGYVDSWDVQYTHFTSLMVPMRAVIDFSFSLLPQPSATTGQNANAGNDATTAATQLTNGITGQQIVQSLLPPGSNPNPGTGYSSKCLITLLSPAPSLDIRMAVHLHWVSTSRTSGLLHGLLLSTAHWNMLRWPPSGRG